MIFVSPMVLSLFLIAKGDSSSYPGSPEDGYPVLCTTDNDTGDDCDTGENCTVENLFELVPIGQTQITFTAAASAIDGFISFVAKEGTGQQPASIDGFFDDVTNPNPSWVPKILQSNRGGEVLRHRFISYNIDEIGQFLNENHTNGVPHNNRIQFRLFNDLAPFTVETKSAYINPDGSVFWYGEYPFYGPNEPEKYVNLQITGSSFLIEIIRGEKTYRIWNIDDNIAAIIEIDGVIYL